MFKAYQRQLHKNPLPTKMITCGVLCLLGDCVTQHYVHKNENFNFKRNVNLFLVGALWTAPMLHLWHAKLVPIVSKLIFTESTHKVKTVFTLVVLDQLAFVPILLSGFFFVNSLVNSPTIEGLNDGIKSWQIKYW